MSPTRITVIVTAVVAVLVGYLVAGRPVPAPGAVLLPASTVATTTTQPVVAPTTTEQVVDTTVDSTSPSTAVVEGGPAPSVVDEPSDVVDRSEVRVAVGNANGVAGSAGSLRDLLLSSGYADVIAFDVGATVDASVVFHADGFRDAASRLAEDAGIEPGATAPAALSTTGLDDLDVDLLVVLGLDRP